MPNLMRRVTVTLAGAVIGIGVLAGTPAHAAGIPKATLESSNWAGYYTVADSPILDASAQFTVPNVNCSNSRGPAPYYGSMWVGVGGMADAGGPSWLEQAGIDVTCTHRGSKPKYQPFWEVVPTKKSLACSSKYQGFFGGATVSPNDVIAVAVIAPAMFGDGKPYVWTFVVTATHPDGSVSAWDHEVQLPKGVYTGQTTEVITEYPTLENDSCTRVLPSGFVYLGNVQYTDTGYFTTGEQVDPVTTYPIDLVHSGKVAVSPGQPYLPADSYELKAFNTYYAKNWWR